MFSFTHRPVVAGFLCPFGFRRPDFLKRHCLLVDPDAGGPAEILVLGNRGLACEGKGLEHAVVIIGHQPGAIDVWVMRAERVTDERPFRLQNLGRKGAVPAGWIAVDPFHFAGLSADADDGVHLLKRYDDSPILLVIGNAIAMGPIEVVWKATRHPIGLE